MPLQATSGAASYDAFGGGVAAVPKYIEDYFSTFLFTGNASTQTITNGIDLAGKGGLVWTKNRTNAFDNYLYDTARGVNKLLLSNNTIDQQSTANTLTAFNSNGFTLGNNDYGNITNGAAAVSWTWAKAPKFFDVVTWTGTGLSRTVSHNLGSAPGCIIVKRTDTTADWQVYHRSLNFGGGTAQQSRIVLNTTAAQAEATFGYWDGTAPTSTVFYLGGDDTVNASGGTYVAYLFAHNAGGFGLTGTDNVISCGTYNGTGAVGQVATVGYEPQWVLIKATNTATGWFMFDTMRGMPVGSDGAARLFANTSAAESILGATAGVFPTATGFGVGSGATGLNQSGGTYIYIAIRRGPMAVPTTGTSVYKTVISNPTNSGTSVTGAGFPPDLNLGLMRGGSFFAQLDFDRLRGGSQYLATASTSAEGAVAGNNFLQDGFFYASASGENIANTFMRRAPGFFDEVCYTGTGANTTQAHNLAAVPEMMIFKVRNTTDDWSVLGNFTLTNVQYGNLNTDGGFGSIDYSNSFAPFSAQPTSSSFSLRASASGWNASGNTYVAYLFATVPGVSKVGSYTGTGTTQLINCGFTGGARFVMIKRTNDTGGWYVWDTARGMIPSNDPYLLLNSTAAEVTNTDFVDTAATGFEISSTAPAAINASGGTFIFLAIA